MPELKQLIDHLKSLETGCEDKCLDLKTLKFDIKENEMRLFNDFQNYYFKTDAQNPKNSKVTHAANQFCKICSVPYSFFSKNPEYMKKGVISCWLPSLKSEKSSVLAKLRKNKEGYTIRALLPAEYTNITNSQVVEALVGAVEEDYKIDFVIGDEQDSLILHVRLISKNEFEVCGDKCSVGFSVVCSELGAAPLSVDTLLYRSSSATSFLATYSTESFFSFEYDKIQKAELTNLFSSLALHLTDKLTDIKQKIQEAKEIITKKENAYDMLRSLRLIKGLNERFHTLLFQEIEKDDTIKTKWDFTNKMAIVAKEFDEKKRLIIERAAGSLLGFYFEKN
jgi:hypothetical protein